jgi:lipoprotein-anchoring transpeptidase ErfK/SrfK
LFVGAAVRGGPDGEPDRSAALPGAASGAADFSPEAAQRLPRGAHVIATARGTAVRVHRRPANGAGRVLRARRVDGRRAPLVFLVKRRRSGWVQAYLPTRPNGATGWLRARAVTFAATRYRIEIRLERHQLILWNGTRTVLRATIAKGRAVAPTPTGRYYVTDLLRPPDPNGFYGPYALGLSAHSPVYTRFAGGDGQVGLHGTNQPSSLGRDVSHGCIRVANAVIVRLARRLPLGTPVDISHA